MLIKTVDGMDIHYYLPDRAICMECNENLMEMDKCPLYNFDDDGEICIPEFCDAYTERMTRYEKYIQIDNFVDLFHKHCMDDIYDCCEKSPLRVNGECPVDEEDSGEESCKKCIKAWMLEEVEGMTYANGSGFAGKWIPVTWHERTE